MTNRRIAEAVCAVMGGATVDAVMADHRGSPRAADLRAVCWLVWNQRQYEGHPTYTVTASAWGRDRTAVARGLRRIAQRRLPTPSDMTQIKRLLRED